MGNETRPKVKEERHISDLIPPAALEAGNAASDKELRAYQKDDHHQLDILGRREHLQAKKRMGGRVFWLVTAWLLVTMLMLWMQGTGCFLPWSGQTFYLSDTVLLALITTTTANVALFLTIVIQHLFPKEIK